ncbi:hypothetical protein [Streptomyces sp. NBC_00525]|uniref:hypothetical protein n=1 Tax=Streptomyces sp. NBC_00525 TaxID=2903660 RepID=UPI002E7FE363|nr:hypothetical protein [Streptomyces sp. NBC_00525]WUC94949.1 hypothetical protein OG710_15790 [Streptomyces sp. NBC_00525]
MSEADMDMREAAEHADRILDATLADLRPPVQWAHGPTTAGGHGVTRRRTVMTVISAERRGNFLGVVERGWQRRGIRIRGINNDRRSPAVYARTEDGFGVSLIFGGGQAFFEVDSPWVTPSEVAECAVAPHGPSYEGVYPLPRPHVRCAFWSAGAP